MGRNVITATRQNHALEHATIALILARMGGNVRLAGRATADGFYVFGPVPTEVVAEAAQEGLARLQRGESDLAVSAFCGTNLAVAGTLAGLSSIIAMGNKRRVERLPQVLSAALAAIILAQPLGRLVQKHLTTSSNLPELHIVGIQHMGLGRWTLHKVKTQGW
ncbi:MAG: hypothetical protein HY664_06085 [Chloroflexi bacterium]|nr:hypothetical protein [Chloroflexota bacterium]